MTDFYVWQEVLFLLFKTDALNFSTAADNASVCRENFLLPVLWEV